MSADPDRLFAWALRIILLISVFWLSLFPLSSVDVWLHLGVGQEIVQRGEIPRTGWGSRLFADREWVAHEWAFQAAFFRLHDAFGPRGLVALRAIVAILTAAALLWAMREAGAGPYAACAAAGLGMYVGFTQLFWPARPQIFTQLLLPVVLAILFRGRTGRRRLLLAIPPVLVLWVNLHGGYIIGLGMVVLFFVADLLGPLIGREGSPGWRRALLITIGAGVVACLVNPYTYESLVYPFRYYLGEPITIGNFEWKPLVLARFHLFEALALAAIVSMLMARPGPDLAEVLLGLGFLHMAIVSQRHLVLAGLALGIVLGASWSRWWARAPEERVGALRRLVDEARAHPGLRAAGVLGVLLVGLAAALLSDVRREADSTLWRSDWPMPVAEVDFIEKNGLVDGLFHQYEWGGYVLFRFPGRDAVFIDGRNDLYGRDHTAAYLMTMQGVPDWPTALERLEGWGVRTVLVETGWEGWGLPLARALDADPRWEGRFRGPAGVVFTRRPPEDGKDETGDGDTGGEEERR